MNTITFQRTVTDYMDLEWHIEIAAHMQAFPLSVGMVIEPAVCGRYDAECGVPCQPYERGYLTVEDCEAYICGFKDTMALIDADNCDSDDDGYADEIADREFFRKGC